MVNHIIDVTKDFLKALTFERFKQILVNAIIPSLLFYCVSVFILKYQGFETMEILRDTAQINETSSFLGFLSNIGIWLWVSSVAICFFVLASQKSNLMKDRKELLFFSGILSLMLAVDDFFMIHDRYVNQYIMYLLYVLCVVVLLLRHHKIVLKIAPMAFLLMGFFLMFSIFTDVMQARVPISLNITQLVEEGCKFLGATSWLYFNFRVGSFKE